MVDIPKEDLKKIMDANGKLMTNDSMPDDLKEAINWLNDHNVNVLEPMVEQNFEMEPEPDSEEEDDFMDGSDYVVDDYDYDSDVSIDEINDTDLSDDEASDLNDLF